MLSGWPSDETPGLTVHIPAERLPVVGALVLLAFIGLGWAGMRYHAAEGKVRRLSAEVRAGAARERALEATVARQHQAQQRTDGELEMLRFQMEAVELQLDGVDYLGQQVRAELGLPPGATTWADASSAQVPQGGTYGAAAADVDRLSQAQRRMAAGLADLYRLLDYARQRRADQADAATPVEPEVVAPGAAPANWPARGPVSSPFGWRLFRGLPGFHTGIDIALAYGTQVQATAPGLVLGSGWQPGYGWSVLVQHGRGYNSLYAHLAEVLVAVGDRVTAGDVVGLSGSSGNSTGPHLHYEVWQDGVLMDPRPLMDGTGGR